MKEIIGISNKKTLLILALLCSASIFASMRILRILPTLGVAVMVLWGILSFLLFLAFFRMPKSSIIKEETTLLIYTPFRKYIVEIGDVLSVDVTSQSSKETATLSLRVSTAKGSKKISVIVTNKTEAQKKLKELISE